jgi:hypothetical protein
MRNLNPKINPVTTIMGAGLIITCLVMFITPMFVAVKVELNYWIPGSIGIIGLSLLLIPDDLRGALRKFIGRKSQQL